MPISGDLTTVDNNRCADSVTPQEKKVHRGWVFAIVAFALLMMAIDSTIVATALHDLQISLHSPINWAGWTITGYSLGFLTMLPVTGKLSERFGYRRVFLCSVAAFTLASFCCGLANNIYTLIVLRIIQAAGGAGFTPSATGIIVKYFGDQRDRAVGMFGSIFPMGAMIGPVFGGLFVNYWNWRGIFLINVPIGLTALALAWHFIPCDRDSLADSAKKRMDFPGMLSLGTGLLTIMLAVSYLGNAQAKLISAGFLLPFIMAVTAFLLFFHHIRRSAAPFIEPRVLYGKNFGIVNFLNIFFGGLASGSIILLPLYAINRYGLDALNAGTLLVAQGIASVILSFFGAVVLRYTGYRPPYFIGGLAILMGVFLLAIPPIWFFTPYTWLAATAFFIGAGRGFSNPASRNASLQLAPDRSSTIAAIRSMTMQIGSISTVSIVTAILASSSTPGHTQSVIYMMAAVLLLILLPLIRYIPEHRGAW